MMIQRPQQGKQPKFTNKNKETTSVQNPIFLAASQYNCLMYRQQSGLFRSLNDPERKIMVGMPGMSDSAMIVPLKITPEMVGQTIGVSVQAEFKTENGRQSPKQKNWQAATESAGGIYKIFRTVDEFHQFMRRFNCS